MAIKLGTASASLYLGSTPVAAYLGAVNVYATLPGAVFVDFATAVNGETLVAITPPANGITGYVVYVDDVSVAIDSVSAPDENGQVTITLAANYDGQEVEVAAVNAVGEGPRSSPVTVAPL
jgi:hypothetical protein